jgi:hypothetical protein
VITVSITATNYVVQSTSTDFPVTVICDNTVFTVTNQVTNFTITNVSPNISFTTDGLNGFDFTSKNKGEWVSGFTYSRNDVVYYEYSTYICSIDPLSTLVSSVNPKLDPENWELFIFNEWPRAYLTVTNQLTAGTATIGGQLDVYGDSYFHANDLIGIYDLTAERITAGEWLKIGNNSEASTATLTINGLQYPANRGTYGQVLYTNGYDRAAWVNLGELTFWQLSEDLQTEGFNIVSSSSTNQLTIGGGRTGSFHNSIKFNTVAGGSAIDVHGITNFDNRVRIAGSATIVSNTIIGGTLEVVGDTKVSGKLRVDDVLGIEGWDGSAATYVKVNTGIKFPDGTTQTTANAYSLPTASTTVLGGIKVGNGLYMSSQFLNVSAATSSTIGGVIVGTYLSVSAGGVLTVNTTTLAAALGSLSYTLPIATDTVLGGIKVGSTLNINGTTGVLNADYATTSSVGVVQVGEYLTINTSTAVLSINTATLGAALDALSYTLPVATTSTLGGIKIGNYLTINTTTGVMSINTATLGPALVDITLPIASSTVLGGVKVGPNLAINSSTGVLNVPLATTSTVGVIKVGNGLSIDGVGTLSLGGSNSYGNISLTEDMETNGYNIRRDASHPNVKLLLETIQALLQGGTTGTNITVTTSTVEINTLNTTTNQVLVKSPVIVLGYDIYNSKVQASGYYDFAGTGAAFFPANVKFSDDTIQRTAWRGYDQGLI